MFARNDWHVDLVEGLRQVVPPVDQLNVFMAVMFQRQLTHVEQGESKWKAHNRHLVDAFGLD